jgi:hypothetical protein
MSLFFKTLSDMDVMNPSAQDLLSWLNREINKGNKTIVVPAYLLENISSEELTEAHRLAKINGCKIVIES